MRVLVLGAAVSGTAAARLGQRLGHRVTVFDSNPRTGADLVGEGIAVVAGEWESDLLAGVDLVVASPGFPLRSTPITDAFEAGLPVWSELEFAWRELTAPVVAVTGTNGKTTVAEATAAMLNASGISAAAVGNIGTALSSVVGDDIAVWVLEASSFQLDLTESFHPQTSVLLNIAPDHLDWHASYHAYAAAKAKIFAHQGPGDLLVYDADDPGVAPLVEDLGSRSDRPRLGPVSGRRRPSDGWGPDGDFLHLPGVSLPLSELSDSNPIQLVDMAAAAAAASDRGATPEAIAAVCQTFRPGRHRRHRLGSWSGVTFVDDSKATNPHAALASIASFPSVVLIAGGMNKGLDITPLARAKGVRHLVAIGEQAPVLLAAAEPGKVTEANSMEEAVAEAVAVAQPGDTVLLAPGCASFDMFESYGDRGEAFIAAVRKLTQGGAA
ncbi:MAG TPA: UDP-N-acetylmuramoyl-L-alanine--D-glutamate ligase [Acidimicrobiia bacterium]|nr:UDP-N-acetylmuramoyl-L-alanine--D-glutamate ligase [Acidimicrobiia bacterium]